MKISRFFALILVLLVFSLSFGTSNVQAKHKTLPQSMCWEVGEDPPQIVKLYAMRTGPYYLLTGEVTTSEGEVHNIITGTAKIDGEKVLMTLIDSGKDDVAIWTSISYVVLDIDTLDGEAESIGHDYCYDDQTLDTQRGLYTLTYSPSCR